MLTMWAMQFLEIDQIDEQKIGDKTEKTYITPALSEELAQTKVRVFEMLEPPIKDQKVKSAEVVEEGKVQKKMRIVTEAESASTTMGFGIRSKIRERLKGR